MLSHKLMKKIDQDYTDTNGGGKNEQQDCTDMNDSDLKITRYGSTLT